MKKKKKPVSHKMPKLDLSSITLVYGVSDALRAAAIKSLDLRTLSARMPGVPRPHDSRAIVCFVRMGGCACGPDDGGRTRDRDGAREVTLTVMHDTSIKR